MNFPRAQPQLVAKALAGGRERLEHLLDRRICGYVPPFNHTANSTLLILKDLGFTVLSGQRNHKMASPLRQWPIDIDIMATYGSPPKLKTPTQIESELACCPGMCGIMYHLNVLDPVQQAQVRNLLLGLSTVTALPWQKGCTP